MQPTTAAEKELLKENLYLNRVQEVLRNHRGFLANYPSKAADASEDTKRQYAAEQSIISEVTANERYAFACGIAVSGIVFASVRYGPRYLASMIGGKEKARKIKEADEIAEKAKTRWIQKNVAFIVEVGFGAWAGWRGYNIISAQNSDSYEAIAKIPLCAGRR